MDVHFLMALAFFAGVVVTLLVGFLFGESAAKTVEIEAKIRTVRNKKNGQIVYFFVDANKKGFYLELTKPIPEVYVKQDWIIQVDGWGLVDCAMPKLD